MNALTADRAEIARFVNVLFRHADEGTYVSLRTFEHRRDAPPVEIKAFQLNGEGLGPIVARATGAANRAAKFERPAVFSPPVCTFRSAKSAAETDVANGLAIAVDCDEHCPRQAVAALRGILGGVTMIVRSGGEWADPATGALEPKLHAYFLLPAATRTAEDHARLKRANCLATALAGSDPTAQSVAHCLRWPGSIHRKARPCRAVIDELHEEFEVELGEALGRLEDAARLTLEHTTGKAADRLRAALDIREAAARDTPPPDPDAHDADLDALAEAIPNDDEHWSEWISVGLAFYAAGDGSAEAFNAWDTWSGRSEKYHDGTNVEQWERFSKSPPDRTGKGALVKRARRTQPDFRLPSYGPRREDSHWEDADPRASEKARSRPNGPTEEAEEEGKAKRPATPTPGPRSMAEFAGKPVPTLAYVIPSWIPLGKPVLFCGRGGAGKTTLVCQLAAARAIGATFLGMDVPKGRSLAVLCEEDEGDVHRLLAQLVDNHFHRDFAEFADAYFWPRAGEDNALVWCDRRGQVQATPFYNLLAEKIGDTKPDLLGLDNARHVALINENDNAVVTAAWSLLHRLMVSTATMGSTTITTTGTTLLLGHVPKNSSAEFAGGASWENLARSRLYLGPLKADTDEEPIENDPRRILRRGKANASGTASLEIVLDNGGFRLEHPDNATYGDRLARDMRRGQACQAFLDALATLTEQRRHTSHAPSAQNFAPKVMRAAGLGGDFTKAELETAMQTLFKDGRIKAGMELWRGPDRHPVVGIGRCG